MAEISAESYSLTTILGYQLWKLSLGNSSNFFGSYVSTDFSGKKSVDRKYVCWKMSQLKRWKFSIDKKEIKQLKLSIEVSMPKFTNEHENGPGRHDMDTDSGLGPRHKHWHICVCVFVHVNVQVHFHGCNRRFSWHCRHKHGHTVDVETDTNMDTDNDKGKDMNMFMGTDNLNRHYTKN